MVIDTNMQLLAYNYFNLDPNGDFQSSTLNTGGKLVSDLQPVWGTFVTVAIGLLVVIVIFSVVWHFASR